MKKVKRLLAMLLALVMLVSLMVACGKDEDPVKEDKGQQETNKKEETPKKDKEDVKKEEVKKKYTTLVLGTSKLNAVFNPFFSTSAYDSEINDRVHSVMITNDRLGAPASQLVEYKTPEEVKDAEGNIQTVYTFKLKEGVVFSDGEPVTADDIMFTYMVYCDPTYDGSGTIYTTPILGVNEYRYDDMDYADSIAALEEEAQTITDEDMKTYLWGACSGDYDSYGADAINGYTEFTNPDGLEGDELKKAEIMAYVEKEFAEYYDDYVSDTIASKFKRLEREYILANLSGGEARVKSVEGIKKIDDMTVQVTIQGVDPKAIWNLGGIEIMPEHYYGKNFKKGDLSYVKSLNDAPLGAGAYTFEKFENNVVTLKANPLYFKGEPKVPTLKYQVVDKSNQLEAVKLGEMDIADPTASPEMVELVKEAGIHYELIENLGYGYIGINAKRVYDKNVRKGLMHLMNRAPAVETYYGELATVIERPMSRVSWAYPKDADEVYGFNPEKALEQFKLGGYEQVEVDGKTVLQKDGEQLKVEVGIAGDGIMDHPSAPILTQMKEEMDKLGAVLEINDCDGNILFDRLDAGEWDMWVAAWQATIDPDMYQIYHTVGPDNHYKIYSDKLDELIIDARRTTDIEKRKLLYKKALDIIMDEAVEMPVYQRKNMYIFNPEVVMVETLPKDMTPFYGYLREVETLELR